MRKQRLREMREEAVREENLRSWRELERMAEENAGFQNWWRSEGRRWWDGWGWTRGSR